ncbi:MAG TPA: hypothetical protein DD473_21995 [Planctomycetaceae bacterium]|nr:hypothetical protein [Planctomycetaceae bacterium]
MNITEVGRIFGISSHVLGNWLKENGFRRGYGNPSPEAYERKLVDTSYNTYGTYNVLWDAEKLSQILEEAGFEKVNPPPDDLVEQVDLEGPFSIEPTDDGPINLVDGNQNRLITVHGQSNSVVVAKILNLAHESGFLRSQIAKQV